MCLFSWKTGFSGRRRTQYKAAEPSNTKVWLPSDYSARHVSDEFKK